MDLLAISATLASNDHSEDGVLVLQRSRLVFRKSDGREMQIKRSDAWITFPTDDAMQVTITGDLLRWTLTGDVAEQNHWKNTVLS